MDKRTDELREVARAFHWVANRVTQINEYHGVLLVKLLDKHKMIEVPIVAGDYAAALLEAYRYRQAEMVRAEKES